MEQPNAARRPLSAPRPSVPELVSEVSLLYREAGSPSYRRLEVLIARNDEALSRSTIGRMLRGHHNPRWGRWDSLIRCLAEQSIYVEHDVDILIKRLHSLYVGSGPGTGQAQQDNAPPPLSPTAIFDAQSEQAVAAAWRDAQVEIASARAAAAAGEVASLDHEEKTDQSEAVTPAEARADNGFDSVAASTRVRLTLTLFLYSVCGLLAGGVVSALVSSQVLGGWAPTGPVAGIIVGLFTGEVMAGLARHQGSDSLAVRHPTPGLTGVGGLVGLAAGTAASGAGATHFVEGLLLGCGAGIAMGALMGSMVLAGRALNAGFCVDEVRTSATDDASDITGP
ncbi:hypothetical protein [Streptomyces sp. WAC04114]|uniref:hypothetical protein n=1 Tax=Streptomyces sp. WAC04114 TaxID=2867961 RepID=UPI001C8CD45A|nr:hypothetical protein [Streptomyces sp. WAC04114]MBX9363204.1 hypothetical protein [Streptomyces sp. WAC04114]